jgi:hypothetical protein
MANRTKLTPLRGDRLLAKLRLGYSISAACRAERISRTAYYDWRKDDPEFATAADLAIEDGTDVLEDAARNRAVKQSDMLLTFLLKHRRPATYGDKSIHEITGPDGAPLVVLLNSRPDGPA